MELKITADVKNLEAMIARFPEASRAARMARITEAVLLLEGEIKRETPVGAGPIHLRDTFFYKVYDEHDRIWGLVGSPAAYGVPVEMGTKPHFPPVAPLQHWVERKLGIGGKEAKAVAFLIARAIARRGTKGARMATRSVEKNEARIMAILERIGDDIVRQVQS